MDINELTIGQAKELSNMFGSSSSKSQNLLSRYIGKYVICRSRNEGVNAGFVVAADETGVILTESRRLYYHKPANKNTSWYEGVAETGLSSDSKVGQQCEKVIIEDYSLTICSDKAKQSIAQASNNEQS